MKQIPFAVISAQDLTDSEQQLNKDGIIKNIEIQVRNPESRISYEPLFSSDIIAVFPEDVIDQRIDPALKRPEEYRFVPQSEVSIMEAEKVYLPKRLEQLRPQFENMGVKVGAYEPEKVTMLSDLEAQKMPSLDEVLKEAENKAADTEDKDTKDRDNMSR